MSVQLSQVGFSIRHSSIIFIKECSVSKSVLASVENLGMMAGAVAAISTAEGHLEAVAPASEGHSDPPVRQVTEQQPAGFTPAVQTGRVEEKVLTLPRYLSHFQLRHLQVLNWMHG